jgi:mannose-6-phosphate isomerase-like protein (cupin superfamily)
MSDGLIVRRDESAWFEDGADRGRVIVPGSETNGAYSVMQWVIASTASTSPRGDLEFGPHRHAGIEETFCIQSGSIDFLVGETVSTLRANESVRVPPGVRHGYVNHSGHDVEMLVIFSPGGFEELFVRYRSDRSTAAGDGFTVDAKRFFDTEFEA